MSIRLQDITLFNQLEEHHKKSIERIVEKIRNESISIEIAQQFNQYTLHDLNHFHQVAKNAAVISRVVDLHEYEKYLLLCACYCHDLGMKYTNQQVKLREYDVNVIRKEHAKLSKIYIQKKLIAEIPTEKDRDLVGRISEGHGRWDWDHEDFEDWDEVRVRLLVFILSLSDVLDLRHERRSPSSIETQEEFLDFKMNPISKAHWLKHYYSAQPKITIKKRRIEIELRAKVGIENNELNSKKQNIDRRHSLIREMIQKEVVSVIEHEQFKKVAEDYCTIKLKKFKDGDWPCNVSLEIDHTKFLFPEEYVKYCFEYNMINPRSIDLQSQNAYYKTRINGFISSEYLQFSYTIKPQSFATKSKGERFDTTVYAAWDIIMISPSKHLEAISQKISDKAIRERITFMLEELEAILFHDRKKIYTKIDGRKPYIPSTTTSSVCKKAYRNDSDVKKGLQGRIELNNLEQKNTYNVFYEAFFNTPYKKVAISDDKNIGSLTNIYAYLVSIVPISEIIGDLIKRMKDEAQDRLPLSLKNKISNCITEGTYTSKVFKQIKNAKYNFETRTFVKREPEFTKLTESHFKELRVLEKYSFLAPWKFHKKSIESLLSDNEFNYVLMLKRSIIGYIFARKKEDKNVTYIEIRKMVVHPLCRGRGLGIMLLDKIKSEANLEIRLNVRKSNKKAIKLYEHYGFERNLLVEKQYKIGKTEEDLIGLNYVLKE